MNTNAMSRRKLGRLAGGGLVGTAAAGAAAATFGAAPATATAEQSADAGPGSGQRPTSFLFVTGAGGAGGAPSELALRGHRVAGVDLPGHGPSARQYPASYQAPQDLKAFAKEPSPLAGVTLDDFAEAAIDSVRKLARFGPVILVGFSMGGSTLTRVVNEVPQLIDRVVYDSAHLCVELPSPAKYLETPEAEGSLGDFLLPQLVGDPIELGALRVNYRSADPEFLKAAKAAIMADGNEAEFTNMLAGLQPDESLTVASADARIDPKSWGRVPHTYIRHTRDRMIPIALQDRMIAEADRATGKERFDVRTVEASHTPTQQKFGEILNILDSLAT